MEEIISNLDYIEYVINEDYNGLRIDKALANLNPILSRNQIQTLIDDMIETMYKYNGVGLAAVQVGILKRVVVIDVEDGEGVRVLINPKITKTKGEQEVDEGCLSFPNQYAKVIRPKEVTVEALDRSGKKITIKAKDFIRLFILELILVQKESVFDLDDNESVVLPSGFLVMIDEILSDDYKKAKFESVRVCGIPCMFVDIRIDRNTVPEGIYQYEIGGDDDSGGEPARVQKGVWVNFFGTLICDQQLPLDEDKVLWLQDGDFVWL